MLNRDGDGNNDGGVDDDDDDDGDNDDDDKDDDVSDDCVRFLQKKEIRPTRSISSGNRQKRSYPRDLLAVLD